MTCEFGGDHSWYQEGDGRGARRCCTRCGLVQKMDPLADISSSELQEFRRRAGVSPDVLSRIETTGADPNRRTPSARKRLIWASTIFALAIVVVGGVYDLWWNTRGSEREFSTVRQLATREDGSEVYILLERVDPRKFQQQFQGDPAFRSPAFFRSPTYVGRPERGQDQHRMLLYFSPHEHHNVPNIVRGDAPKLPMKVRVSSRWYTTLYQLTTEGGNVPVLEVRECEVLAQ